MSKYRLVRDNYSATSQEWFLVQKWDNGIEALGIGCLWISRGYE